ncbi:WD40-repeat-containing domain protein, partial [Phellopilus nigrolimitatus]
CLDGTRTALLAQITDWAESQSSQPVYCLTGPAGSGKSSIAISAVLQFKEKKMLGGNFFCSAGVAQQRSSRNILPKLAFMLAKKHGPFSKHLLDILREDTDDLPNSRDIMHQCQQLFTVPLKQITSGHEQHIFVLVVDALDECEGPATTAEILQTLLQLSKAVPWLKVLLTSRPQKELHEFLDKEKEYILPFPLQLTESKNDILLFTEHNISRLIDGGLSKYHAHNGVSMKLAAKANGLFIWSSTIFRYIGKGLSVETRLKEVLKSDIGRQTAAEAGLDILYARIFEKATEDISDPDNMKLFKGVLEVMLTAYQPLAIEDISHLLSTTVSDPLHVVTKVCDYMQPVLYKGENAAMQFYHQSFLDFLTSEERCTRANLKDIFIDIKSCHARVGIKALALVKKEARFNICGIKSSYLANTQVHGLEDQIKTLPSYLVYSSLYWPQHITGAEFSPVQWSIIQKELETLFSGPKLLYWLEIVSLKQSLSALIDSLPNLISWLSQMRLTTYCKELLDFLQMFYVPITESTPHLYLSSLPFLPTKSKMFKDVKPLFSQTLCLSSGQSKNYGITKNQFFMGSEVNSVTYSPDGQHIVSGSQHKTVRIWDAKSGQQLHQLSGHTGYVKSVAYSPDGQHIVSGSHDNTVRIWDAKSGKQLHELSGHSDWVKSVAYSPDGQHIVSGSWDQTVRIWDAKSGQQLHELSGHRDYITSVAYSPNGQHIVSGSVDKTVRIWDAKSGQQLHELSGHTGRVTSVAYSPDGQHIVSDSWDQTVRLWDAKSGQQLHELSWETGSINSVAYSPDGQHIVFESSDKTVRIWDTKSGNQLHKFSGHSGWVNSVAYSPDGQHIVSGSDDKTLRIWKLDHRWKSKEPNSVWELGSSAEKVLYWIAPVFVMARCGWTFITQMWVSRVPCYQVEVMSMFVVYVCSGRRVWSTCV